MSALRFARSIIVLAVGLTLPALAWADDALRTDSHDAWAACQAEMAQAPDDWIGWRRRFFNGYGDDFAFWDNRSASPPKVSILRTVQWIDATASETTIFCFRGDGTLAVVRTTMVSPNSAAGKHAGDIIRREGSIFVSRQGEVLEVSGQIVDPDGRPHRLDSSEWQLARPCAPVAFYGSADEVMRAYQAELGDIEGKRPAFAPRTLDWCAQANKP